MNATLAFNTGWMEGSTDYNPKELTAREIAVRHPEFTSEEVGAYHNGRMDAIMGDTFRFNLANTRKRSM